MGHKQLKNSNILNKNSKKLFNSKIHGVSDKSKSKMRKASTNFNMTDKEYHPMIQSHSFSPSKLGQFKTCPHRVSPSNNTNNKQTRTLPMQITTDNSVLFADKNCTSIDKGSGVSLNLEHLTQAIYNQSFNIMNMNINTTNQSRELTSMCQTTDISNLKPTSANNINTINSIVSNANINNNNKNISLIMSEQERLRMQEKILDENFNLSTDFIKRMTSDC